MTEALAAPNRMSDKFFHRGKEARFLGQPRELHDARVSSENRLKFYEGWDAQDRFMQPPLTEAQQAESNKTLADIRTFLAEAGFKSKRAPSDCQMTPAGLITISIKFPPGDYRHAMRCYHIASEWTLNPELCARKDLALVIHPPAHPLSPATVFEVPVELINETGWETLIDVSCSSEEAASFVESIQLSHGATLLRL